MNPEAKKRGDELKKDQIFIDLTNYANERIGMAAHDSLLRFKWAKYDYSDAACSVAFVMAHMMAVLYKNTKITPKELGELMERRLIREREKPDADEDDDDD